MRRVLALAFLLAAASASADETPPAALAPCAGCHMVYPPAMLPAASWDALMAKLPEHFGAAVAPNAQAKAAARAYLGAHAADGPQASARDRHFLDATPGPPPARVTQTLWWRERHIDIDFAKPGMPRAPDCRACHEDGLD